MRIRELREARGLLQVQVADALNVSAPAVVSWESGKTLPKADKLPLLASLLCCTIDDLFGDDLAAVPIKERGDRRHDDA